MTKSFVAIIFILFFINNLDAQNLIFSKSAGSDTIDSDLDQGYDLITDSSGNSYVTGSISNWTTGSIFGQGEVNQTILNVNGSFIAKYDTNGLLLWVKQIEANNNGVVSNAIALDANNIYITGYYSVEVTFGIGTITQTTLYANSASRDLFFAKYSQDGDFIWAKSFGGVNDDAPGGSDIYLDSNQNIYITGAFNGNVVFGAGETNETTLAGNQSDMFLSKYDSNGNLIWVQKAGGNNGDEGKNLDLDSSGNIYVTGNFYNSATFGQGLTNVTTLSGNTEAAYIAKYDNNGTFLWAQSPFYVNGPGASISGDIKIVNDDRIVFTGSYYGLTLMSDCVSVDGNSEDMIVIQYDTDGNYIWNDILKSDSLDRGLALDVDASNNIFVTGYFSNDVIIDEGKCNETTLQNKGNTDIFIVAYDINGQLLSATSAGSSGWEQGAGIDVDNSGNVYITGYYTEDIIFGPSEVNETTLFKNGVNEIYVAKYNLNLNTVSGTTYAGESNCIEICSSSDPINLFDSLLNNPDSGGIWSPTLASGSSIFDPLLDTAGVYRYSVMESNCVSDYADITVDFTTSTINAGDDTTINICSQDTPFSLFDRIEGNPDTGGTWSPSLSSGTDMFDPSIDAAGIYTYTLSNVICNNVSSQMTLNINSTIVNAGTDGTISVCSNDPSFNLFDILNDNPDTGGTWSPSLNSGTGVFDPSKDAAGTYTYKIINGDCGSDTSEVEVIINKEPNAGANGSFEVCTNVNSIDLYDGLNGNPDIGGTWSPSLSSGTGMFDPSIDTAGIYTYTVISSFCGTDTSEVNVTITHVTPISDYEIKTKEFSSNNSIEIIINSNLDYEFSLDGINYQSNNVFYNLAGGDYTVYVRETSGCGILQETVSILDCPKFFTPNGDGNHDTWSLKGKTDKNYSIYIYDRYGKLLKNLTSPKSSWDGTFNGRNLPSDDYWFKVVFSDGIIKKGHFTLKR